MKESCPFHLALHGCNGYADSVGAKYGPTASANNIVMLFPQCSRDCWDYEGKTGSDYNNRNSSEMTAFMKMIEKLKEKPSGKALSLLQK